MEKDRMGPDAVSERGAEGCKPDFAVHRRPRWPLGKPHPPIFVGMRDLGSRTVAYKEFCGTLEVFARE